MDENPIISSDEKVDVSDTNDKVETLAQKISFLQIEKKKIEEEFGVQRAKMKDLYLQKENEFKQQLVDQQHLKSEIKRLQTELDESRSQLTVVSLEYQSKLDAETRKYQEELSSLQHLLNENVEENLKFEKENEHLRYSNMKLLSELNEWKIHNNHSSLGADMPQILSVPGTVISTLARKVTNQITTQLGSTDSVSSNTNTVSAANATLSQFSDTDSLDDSMRKAQEDAAVLRSLVVPLEEEIKALKDKLREMDAEVRKYKSISKNSSGANKNGNVIVEKIIDLDDDTDTSSSFKSPRKDTSNYSDLVCLKENEDKQKSSTSGSLLEESFLDSSISDKKSGPCEMCSNLEAQLLNAQQKIHDLEKHIVSLERYKQDLSKEAAFRKDMEEKWNEKKEEYKEQVTMLQGKITKDEEAFKELRSTYSSVYEEVTQQLKKLNTDRENNQRELNRLQRENDNLIGKYNKHSQQLQNEAINLPNNVEDLQELILRMQEELISAKIAKETADENVATLTEEIAFLRDHSQSEEQNRIELENKLTENVNKLKNDVHQISQERNHHKEAYKGVDRDNAALRDDIKQLVTKIDRLTNSKKHLEEVVNELKSRVSSLQTELDNSEKVQKDFVLLSQSLQQELEKIRSAETEVRWEHEDDVVECRKCKNSFSVTRRRAHCKHCGRIFCVSCLTHAVNSGPNNRPSKVCDVCHTLLVRDSAPYFSTVPPQCDW